MKPKSWGELTGLLIFDYCPYSQVWTYAQYSDSINDDNYFGLSAVAGTARTVQDSYSTISGATVRTSGESTSYQRALVAAAILAGSDVVKGRF